MSGILKFADFSLTLSVFPYFPGLPQNSLTFPDHRNPGVITAYCANFGQFVFLNPLWRGLETTYDVHLGLIGKHIVDFLLVLRNFFARCQMENIVEIMCFDRCQHCMH